MSTNEFDRTSVHEAAHTVVWLREEEHLGPPTLITALSDHDTQGRVQGEAGMLSQPTPRKVRAIARVLAAGAIAEKLAGMGSPRMDSDDAQKIARLATHVAQGEKPSVASRQVLEKRFREQAEAGAELMLRTDWGAVLRLAATLREFGTLAGDSGVTLARMQLDGPQEPLVPDVETYFQSCRSLDGVPELAEPILAGVRGELKRVA